MADLAAFPIIEIALIATLEDLADIATDVPADPEGTLSWLPFIGVACHGGNDDQITDLSRVTVDCFASTQLAAARLAEQVRQRLLTGPHVGTGFVLDRASTDTKPNHVPYVDSPPPYRYTAAYSISARRS